MTVLHHTIPADLMSGLRTGDEQALEHGFQELFPVLLKEADDELHDPASAGRVVERAFLQVIGDPEVATNSDTVARALEQAMHQSIVREKSRLAALRRFEHNEGVSHRDHHTHAAGSSDPAHVWERIQQTRHQSESARPSVEEAKHRTAAHMAEAMNDKRKWSIPLLIAGVITVCAAAYGLSRVNPRPSEKFIASELAAATARHTRALPGQIGNISLADETTVRLGAGSLLNVSKDVAEKLRAASVDGAASFTIAPARRPFELRLAGVALTATGGQIDVRSQSGKPTLVRVVSGTPEVRVGDSTWIAAAGQSFVFTSGKIRPATAAEIDEALGWMEGRFVVNGTVRDVVDAFRQWYDADVGIGDNSIATWPAQVVGSLESLTSSIQSLEKSAKVKMAWSNRHMLLFRR